MNKVGKTSDVFIQNQLGKSCFGNCNFYYKILLLHGTPPQIFCLFELAKCSVTNSRSANYSLSIAGGHWCLFLPALCAILLFHSEKKEFYFWQNMTGVFKRYEKEPGADILVDRVSQKGNGDPVKGIFYTLDSLGINISGQHVDRTQSSGVYAIRCVTARPTAEQESPATGVTSGPYYKVGDSRSAIVASFFNICPGNVFR